MRTCATKSHTALLPEGPSSFSSQTGATKHISQPLFLSPLPCKPPGRGSLGEGKSTQRRRQSSSSQQHPDRAPQMDTCNSSPKP